MPDDNVVSQAMLGCYSVLLGPKVDLKIVGLLRRGSDLTEPNCLGAFQDEPYLSSIMVRDHGENFR